MKRPKNWLTQTDDRQTDRQTWRRRYVENQIYQRQDSTERRSADIHTAGGHIDGRRIHRRPVDTLTEGGHTQSMWTHIRQADTLTAGGHTYSLRTHRRQVDTHTACRNTYCRQKHRRQVDIQSGRRYTGKGRYGKNLNKSWLRSKYLSKRCLSSIEAPSLSESSKK